MGSSTSHANWHGIQSKFSDQLKSLNNIILPRIGREATAAKNFQRHFHVCVRNIGIAGNVRSLDPVFLEPIVEKHTRPGSFLPVYKGVFFACNNMFIVSIVFLKDIA